MLLQKPMSGASAAALILLVTMLAACSKKTAAPVAVPPQTVTVVTLAAQDVALTRELAGRTNPFLVAEVRPQVNGLIKQRLFTEGGMVKAGQPLYQLDDATYRANDASARAGLARAQATLKSAELNARRLAELVRVDAVSRQENENAAAALAQAKADVAAAQAALESAGVTVGFARITAPIGGRIGKSSVTQGALVTANQAQALAAIQQLDPMYVDLTQSAGELLQLRRELAAGKLVRSGTVPVQILLQDGTRYPHDGKLIFTDVTVDPGTGSFGLRVTVPNPEQTLLPGMYVRALVGSGVRQHAILVPQQGISRDAKGDAAALVVTKDNKVETRAVKTSRTVGDQWLVDQGLAVGDRVVVAGLQKIAPGARVTPVERTAPAQAETVADKR